MLERRTSPSPRRGRNLLITLVSQPTETVQCFVIDSDTGELVIADAKSAFESGPSNLEAHFLSTLALKWGMQ